MTLAGIDDRLSAENIFALIKQLSTAEDALEQALAGKADAVIDPNLGTTILLRHAREALQQAHDRYHRLVTHMNAVVFELSPDGTVIFVNEGIRLTGYTPDEVLGSYLWTLLFSSKTSEAEEFAQTLRERDVSRHEISVTSRSGDPLILEVDTANQWDAKGNLVKIVGFALDKTANSKAKADLRRSEERYRIASEMTSDFTFGFRILPDGYICRDWTTEAFTRITGYEPETLDSLGWWRLFPREDLPLVRHTMNLLLDGRSESREWRIIAKNDQTKWLQGYVRSSVDPGRGCVTVYGAAQDITERKHREDTLRLLDSAVRQAGDSIIITTANLDWPGPTIVFVNPAFTTITGYTAEYAIGKNPRFLQGPKTSRKVLDELRRCLEEGREFYGESINYRRDGSEFFMNWRVAPIKNPDGIVTHYIAIQRDVSDSKRAAEALQESEARLRELVDHIPQVFWMTPASNDRLLYASPMFEKIWGIHPEDPRTLPFPCPDWVHPDDRDRVLAALAAPLDSKPIEIEYRLIPPSEKARKIRDRRFPVRDVSGQITRLAGVAEDITNWQILEEQLLQSQKLEAIGKLAAGVAHDFNNLLTGIIGFSDILLCDETRPTKKRDLEQIRALADRAAALTRQLLAFSRRQHLEPLVLNLNEMVHNLSKMLGRLIGEDIELDIKLARDLWNVRGDIGQLEQVLMNLVVNARDAMPDGGRLAIETTNQTFTETSFTEDTVHALGEYVLLSVADTGSGMDPSVLPHIFEPFFTTKDVGKGTGLGLSTVYGIVRQHDGHISVESQPGSGSVFRVYIPRVGLDLSPAIPPLTEESSRGAETILLVEDDSQVRVLVERILKNHGYRVIAAGDPLVAARIFESKREDIDLLLTDVVMPGLNGKSLYEILSRQAPTLKVLYISGYVDERIAGFDDITNASNLLRKPFEPRTLLQTVRQILDG